MIGRLSYRSGYATSSAQSMAPSLWRGLVGAFCPGLGYSGSTLRDLSSARRDGSFNSTPLSSWRFGGVEFATSSSAHVSLSDSISNDISTQCTMFVSWIHDGTSNAGHFFDNRLSSNDGYDFSIVSGGSIEFTADRTNAVTVNTQSVGSIPRGMIATAAAVYDGSQIAVYLNGVLGGSDTQTGVVSQSSSPKVGNQANNADPLGSDRYMLSFLFYDRPLCLGELSALHRDCFLPFRLIPAVSYRVPAAAPSGQYSDIFQSTIFGGSVIA